MAAVVVLFAFLLLSTVGGNQRDGFQEGNTNKLRGGASMQKGNPAAVAKKSRDPNSKQGKYPIDKGTGDGFVKTTPKAIRK